MSAKPESGSRSFSPQRPDPQRKLKARIHEVIFEADTPAGAVFDVMLLMAIVASIVVVCLETVPGVGVTAKDGSPGRYTSMLRIMSWVFTGFFTVEYVLRLYCVRKPSNYATSFWGIIDLMAFLPDYLLLAFGAGLGSRGSFSVIRGLRLLRVFRIFKLSWFQLEAEDLGSAIWRARAKIVVFLTVVMILVTVMGTLMYEIENALSDDCQFTSIPEGIYWAIVTMTTVGFGDIVPVSIAGKILSAILILIGYSLIIVPTGFVSAEVIGAKLRKGTTTINCPSCMAEGLDTDARYCKRCGDKLYD